MEQHYNDNRATALILDQVPDEIIGHLLYYVSPDDNLSSVQLVSRRFYQLANEPLLWKHHCRTSFKYWSPQHRIQDKIAALAQATNWKRLFILRSARNRKTSTLLDEIIRTKVNRIEGFETIGKIGYDAKDLLLEHCQTPLTAEDGLARRYYSNALLDTVHKNIAIQQWQSPMVSTQQSSSRLQSEQLERALGAYDLFVLHDQPGDLDDITRMLDEIAAAFRSSHVKFQTWSTRKKALELVRWLRAQNLTGVQDPRKDYRNLRNCLIGQALRHPDHESIPIISTAIFCCVASRLGLDARSCLFPTHVHAVVYPQAGQTLDDDPVAKSDSSLQRMFLDPYGNDNEIPLSHLHTTLARLGSQILSLQGDAEQFLVSVPASKMTMRTAQNIKASLAPPGLQDQIPSRVTQLLRGHSTMNADACNYAASWALLMLSPPNNTSWLARLAKFLRRFADSWPQDVWLVEKYLWPRYCSVVNNPRDGFPRNVDNESGNPWHFWQYLRDVDGRAPLIRRRENRIDPTAPWPQVGQVFRHRRYGWLGAIISWHETMARADEYPGLEDLDPADRVRANAFRHTVCFMCITATESKHRVVTLPNIEIVSDSSLVTEDLFPVAGNFFKRFDANACKFVSNIREEFPSD